MVVGIGSVLRGECVVRADAVLWTREGLNVVP